MLAIEDTLASQDLAQSPRVPPSSPLLATTDAFCEHLASQEQVDDARSWEGLASALADAWDMASETWPTLALDRNDYVRYLAARLPASSLPSQALSGLHTIDLYLACGCAQANEQAVAAFDAEYAPEMQRVLESQAVDPTRIDEVQQRLRTMLFVPKNGERKIEKYSGKGRLFSWLRIVVLREAQALLVPENKFVAIEDALADAPCVDDDPELAFLKATYRQSFREAFAEALGTLSSEERNMMRHHHIEGLGVDKLAAIYGVHRATAARRVARSRMTLLEGTRRELVKRLRVDQGELDSIMRLIDSQLDASFHRLLDAP